jgi:exopolyphosphatase/guanosine-5'-triphosphate,3'-diphosphate pyrophosphatase
MIAKAPLIAAIDVGTNSFHLVIASVNQRDMMHIHTRDKEVVRLGSSGNDMKFLEAEAIERGVRALKNFSELAASTNAEVRAVATSAVREAANRYDFLERVRNETGIEVEVISGDEEGRLIYIGALHALPILNKRTLVIDIGGGSTETIVGFQGNIEYVHSEKLGAIRMTKKFFDTPKTTPAQIEACRNFIHGEWTPVLKKLSQYNFETVVGTSGTIINLAIIALSLNQQPIPEIINGLTVGKKEMQNAINRLIKSPTLKQKQEIPGIDPARADILLGGALIFEHIMNFLNFDKIVLSSYALREGTVFDTIQKKKNISEYKHLSHLRYSTIYNLCKVFNIEMKHAEYVKFLSLKLFDDLTSLHKLGSECREILEASALLHDVGYMISHDQHHKHSYYILSNCIMPGFTNDEAEIIANIARYHRKSHPKKKHENYVRLSAEKQRIVRILAGILRISEGLDRRQLQVLSNISALMEQNGIKITLNKSDDAAVNPDIEIWGALQRKQLLEESLGRVISIEVAE